jgi:transposase
MERQKFTTEYKERAVKMTLESSSTVLQVADDLGIGVSNLWRWRKQSVKSEAGQKVFPGSGTLRDAEMAALNRRVRELEMERDTLRVKKAAIYLAQAPK